MFGVDLKTANKKSTFQRTSQLGPSKTEHLFQWRSCGGKSYSIITDHLGTPTEAYDEEGKKVWPCQLDIYGQTRKETGTKNFVPFRYQGQYDDVETDLYYNRFRYYSPESGTYISQDPIGLAGQMPNMYSYVPNVNSQFDPLGLIIVYRALNPGQEAAAKSGASISPKNSSANYTIQQ